MKHLLNFTVEFFFVVMVHIIFKKLVSVFDVSNLDGVSVAVVDDFVGRF
jgi:hypothetical protein